MDLGVDGIESELRSRLGQLALDRASLDSERLMLFTTRYGLLSRRSDALRMHLAELDAKVVTQQADVEQAKVVREIDRHSRLLADLTQLRDAQMKDNADLHEVKGELADMDADVDVDASFTAAGKEHPRVAATAATHQLVLAQKRHEKKTTMRHTLETLAEHGVDPIALIAKLSDLEQEVRRLKAAAAAAEATPQPPSDNLRRIAAPMPQTAVPAVTAAATAGDDLKRLTGRTEVRRLAPVTDADAKRITADLKIDTAQPAASTSMVPLGLSMKAWRPKQARGGCCSDCDGDEEAGKRRGHDDGDDEEDRAALVVSPGWHRVDTPTPTANPAPQHL